APAIKSTASSVAHGKLFYGERPDDFRGSPLLFHHYSPLPTVVAAFEPRHYGLWLGPGASLHDRAHTGSSARHARLRAQKYRGCGRSLNGRSHHLFYYFHLGRLLWFWGS